MAESFAIHLSPVLGVKKTFIYTHFAEAPIDLVHYDQWSLVDNQTILLKYWPWGLFRFPLLLEKKGTCQNTGKPVDPMKLNNKITVSFH